MIGTAVQKALYDAFIAAPSIANGNVFDQVSDEDDRFPRVTIGEEQVLSDDNSCSLGWEVFADIHVWSRTVGFPEAKTIAESVAHRIRSISAVSGYSLNEVRVVDARPIRDPDGLTSHVAVTAYFLLDQA